MTQHIRVVSNSRDEDVRCCICDIPTLRRGEQFNGNQEVLNIQYNGITRWGELGMYSPLMLLILLLNGTVARDFPPPFFFSSKVPTLDPDSYFKFFFQNLFQIRGYLNWSLFPRCMMQRGVKSFRCMMQRGVKSLRCMMQRGVKSLSCMMQRGVKSLSCIMQRGVKSMIVAEIFLLWHVAGSQIFPTNFAAGS